MGSYRLKRLCDRNRPNPAAYDVIPARAGRNRSVLQLRHLPVAYIVPKVTGAFSPPRRQATETRDTGSLAATVGV
jgi:hypothetical protein